MSDLVVRLGETAERLWRLLRAEGELTLERIAHELGDHVEHVTLAVGWLAREDKISMRWEEGELRVALKENAEI